MNKLLIVLLAVCLVSAQAFVKRDTAQAEGNAKQFQDALSKVGNDIASTFAKAFDPEEIKKNFNSFVDGAGKVINQLKAPQTPEKKE